MNKLIIGSDHAGFKLKEKIKVYLQKKGFEVYDAGTHSEDRCDYPVYAFAVAQAVSSGKFKRGILICKSGIGNSIAANRVPFVRAALCYTITAARLSREHNDSNILVLGSAFVTEAIAKRMVNVWLKTGFAGGRHQHRLDIIKQFDLKHKK